MADSLTIHFEILEDLSPDELDRFKFYLTKPVLDGFKPIPEGKLGTNVTQLLKIMQRFYKDQGSIDITLHILKTMNLRDLEDKLKQKIQDLLDKRPQTDTVFPEPSHTMKSDFPKIQPQSSLSQPQQSTPDHISQVSGESRVTKEYVGGASAEKEIESISDSSIVPQVFTPERNPDNDKKTWRFSCCTESQFQCIYTGLVFKMDKGGEVQYQTEPWNCPQLTKRNYVPAGTLFDINCPQGTLSQIHFPHCEVVSEKERLSVIHISDSDEYEMLDPHETTDSYVVLNISGCSKYGLIKRQPKKKHSPINGLVLVFLQESKLNVFLLPKNVDIYEVSENRRKMKEPTVEIYIETNKNCELVPDNTYYLSSDSKEHEVTPLSAKFLDNVNCGNYFPTFQVSLTKLGRVMLNLKRKGSDECVWCSDLKFPGRRPSVFSLSSPYTPPGQDFFHRHKAALETRLGLLRPILSELESCGVLNLQEREEVENKDGSIQNRTLLLMLQKKGGLAQEEFYRVLGKCSIYLVKDLEGPYDYRKSAGCPS